MSDKKEVRFVYTPTVAKNGDYRMLTAAYRFDDTNKCIQVAFTECGKKDQFVKAKGRAIASGRLDSKHDTKITIPYETVSWEGKVKYGLIAAEIVSLLGD